MNRRALLLPVLAFIAACQGGESTQPVKVFPTPPAFLIQDGNNAGGNPDFFFLPPMVGNPGGNANYGDNAFNGSLDAKVRIVALPSNAVVLPPTSALVQGEQYHLNWKVPVSAVTHYRITVEVGSTVLGTADLQTAANSSQLKNVNTNEYIPIPDGRTLPIKFRIEEYALCATPGVGPCGSETINLVNGGDVTTKLPETDGFSGVEIPPQGGTGQTSTITVEPCDDLNPRETDLPTYGPCLRITADPPLAEGALSAEAATVFICDISPFTSSLTPEQKERITLHRFDEPSTMAALPHAHGCEQTVGAAGSLKGFFSNLARGEIRSAGRQLVAMVAPKPLYASMMLDVGAGGLTEDFSDFQFALPAKLAISAGDGQLAAPGVLPIQPQVVVTDLGGDPVLGARVRFADTPADCAALADGVGTMTNAAGHASTSWTIVDGPNWLAACGRGLAGTDFSGPRTGDDPFQPLSDHFGDAVDGPAVPVVTGSVTFAATGTTDPIELVGFGSTFEALSLGAGGTAVGSSTAAPPSGWQSGSGGPTMTAPFGGSYSDCGITSSFSGTTWPVNTDFLFTKTFSSPYSGTLKILVWIDNDAQVWLDGANVTATGFASAAYSFLDNKGNADPSDDWWVHDNCANSAPPTFTIPVTAGSHTLAIWGHDRGGVGYMDVKITIQP